MFDLIQNVMSKIEMIILFRRCMSGQNMSKWCRAKNVPNGKNWEREISHKDISFITCLSRRNKFHFWETDFSTLR